MGARRKQYEAGFLCMPVARSAIQAIGKSIGVGVRTAHSTGAKIKNVPKSVRVVLWALGL